MNTAGVSTCLKIEVVFSSLAKHFRFAVLILVVDEFRQHLVNFNVVWNATNLFYSGLMVESLCFPNKVIAKR